MFSKFIKNATLISLWFLIINITNAELINYRISSNQSTNRIVFETNQKPEIQHLSPQHWQIIFQEEITIKNLPKINYSNSLLENLTINQVTCDLKFREAVEFHYFYLQKPNRLVIDIKKIDNLGKLMTEEHKNNEDKILPSSHQITILELPSNQKSNVFTVVLDPGHGGKDSGAVSAKGTLEKNLNLSIAKKIAYYLKKDKIKVFLTRDEDYFIGLRQRLQIARKYKADLFISIHTDAYWDSQAQGASIFALSPKGATSESARWLAKKENESELGQELGNKDLTVKTVLLDLAQTATIKNSLTAGYHLLKRLQKITKMHSTNVEQAAFLVLKAPEIPSLLIETGFISNKQEEKKLINNNYQNQLAFQIAQGIMDYIKGLKN